MNIAATSLTPLILFNYEEGILEIRGKSYPENVHEVYNKLMGIIAAYAEEPRPKTQIIFEWLYYNTATSKMIAKILMAFQQMDTELKVTWICKSDFTIMIENGEMYKEFLDIDFEIKLV